VSLRALKLEGRFLAPSYSAGQWETFVAGQKARCPYRECRRAWMQVAAGWVVRTRVPAAAPDPAVVGQVTCHGSQCKKSFEFAVDPALTPA
jgi:hypothetical protein